MPHVACVDEFDRLDVLQIGVTAGEAFRLDDRPLEIVETDKERDGGSWPRAARAAPRSRTAR